MSLKAPLNPGHMIPNSMEIYVAKRASDPWLQIGFYKDQSLAAAGETAEDVYSNGTIKKVRDGNKITVSFTAHELTNEKLEILQYWLVELKAGTVVGEVESFKPGEWSFDQDIILKYSNANGTAVDPTSVVALIDGTNQTLVEDTDYTVGVDMFGSTWVKLLSGSKLDANAANSVKITITYSATNGDVKVMEHAANAIAKPFVMCLVNEFEYDGVKKYVRTYLDNCQASKATLQQIADSDDTTVGFPVEITGTVVKQEWNGFSQEESDGE